MDDSQKQDLIPITSRKDRELQDMAKAAKIVQSDIIFAKFKPDKEQMVNKMTKNIAPERLKDLKTDSLPPRIQEAIQEELA